MRHSPSVSRLTGPEAGSSAGERLAASVKLYVDEVFDRTIVALHALLEPIGIDVAKTKFAPGFMAELAAVVQVAAWEESGLRQLIPLEFPPAAVVMSNLVWRYHVDPMAFMDPTAGTAVFNRVVRAWATHCHPDARELLGCDVVMASPSGPAEQAAGWRLPQRRALQGRDLLLLRRLTPLPMKIPDGPAMVMAAAVGA